VTDLLGTLGPLFILLSVLYVGLAVAVGLYAERRGSSGLLWFALAVFASPLIALILLLIVTPQGGRPGRP
jgi:hypothetical protein